MKITFDGMDSFDDAIKEAVTESIADAVSDYRCPEHGERVRDIKVSGSELESLQLTAEICCDQATEEVLDLLGAEDDD
ncbi:MAG: hypothetical protein KY459_01510 [Acidobacteria bacterium]|nr:hypothetical protein [Acidobacteriota bacterium]